MEYLNNQSHKTLSSDHILHPDEISHLVAEIAGPEAAWAKVQYSEGDAGERDIKVIAGEGLGRVIGLRVAQIDGRSTQKWFVADSYDDKPKNWREGNMPAALFDRFKPLRELLKQPKRLLPGEPFLYHRSPKALTV